MKSEHDKACYSFEDIVAGLSLVLMLCLVCSEIVLRGGFNLSFLWSEEAARYLMIWSVYFGAASAIKTGDHLRIEMLIDYLPKRLRKFFDIFAQLWVCAFSIALTCAGYNMVRDSFSYSFMSAESDFGLELGWVQLVIPITFAISAMYAARNVFKLLKRSNSDDTQIAKGA